MRALFFVFICLLASPAGAQTIEKTVETILYNAANHPPDSRVVLSKVRECVYQVDTLSGKFVYQVDFNLLVSVEITKRTPRTELVLHGASRNFAIMFPGQRDSHEMKDMPIVQGGGDWGDVVLNAVSHLRKQYCPGR